MDLGGGGQIHGDGEAMGEMRKERDGEGRGESGREKEGEEEELNFFHRPLERNPQQGTTRGPPASDCAFFSHFFFFYSRSKLTGTLHLAACLSTGAIHVSPAPLASEPHVCPLLSGPQLRPRPTENESSLKRTGPLGWSWCGRYACATVPGRD